MSHEQKELPPDHDLEAQALAALDAACAMPHGPQRTEAMKKAEMLRSAANMDFFRRQRTGEGRASQVPGLKDLQRGPLEPIPYRPSLLSRLGVLIRSRLR